MTDDVFQVVERLDKNMFDLLRIQIGRDLARKMPDLTPEQVREVQGVVMNQITRFGL